MYYMMNRHNTKHYKISKELMTVAWHPTICNHSDNLTKSFFIDGKQFTYIVNGEFFVKYNELLEF